MLNGQRRYGRGCACMYVCVCSPMYVCMPETHYLGVGGIGVGGDGDVYLGESCTEDDGFHFFDTSRVDIGIFQEAVPGEK
jgi:hypothetical protein